MTRHKHLSPQRTHLVRLSKIFNDTALHALSNTSVDVDGRIDTSAALSNS